MSRPIRRWHVIVLVLVAFMIGGIGNDCDGRCPASVEVAP